MKTADHDDGKRHPHQDESRSAAIPEDARWHRVYLLVIVSTVVVIAALWLFSVTFSS